MSSLSVNITTNPSNNSHPNSSAMDRSRQVDFPINNGAQKLQVAYPSKTDSSKKTNNLATRNFNQTHQTKYTHPVSGSKAGYQIHQPRQGF